MKALHLRLKAPRALFAGICLSVFLFSACGAVPDPNAPHVPKTQTETNIMNMLHKFLDSKIAGKTDDQQTCTESTALSLDARTVARHRDQQVVGVGRVRHDRIAIVVVGRGQGGAVFEGVLEAQRMAHLVQRRDEVVGPGREARVRVAVVDPDVAGLCRTVPAIARRRIGVAPGIGVGRRLGVGEGDADLAGIGDLDQGRRDQAVPDRQFAAHDGLLGGVEHAVAAVERLGAARIAVPAGAGGWKAEGDLRTTPVITGVLKRAVDLGGCEIDQNRFRQIF